MYYTPSINLERLNRQKDEIENLIKSYQNTQQPINNIINTNPIQQDLYELKETNHTEYEEYKKKIIGMVYDHKITKDLAKEIVDDMKPKGEYWTMDEIRGVVGELPNLPDVYVVMNSLVNDYGEVISPDDVEKYVTMTNAWINDVDGHKNKTWWYFVNE